MLNNNELVFYRPTFVQLYEIVTPTLYANQYKINRLDMLWSLFDSRLLWTLDRLREIYGPIIINTWYKKMGHTYRVDNSGFKERGLREHTSSVGAIFSQHKFGNAIDCHFNSIASPDIVKQLNDLGMFSNDSWRQETSNPIYNAFKYITCIERSISGKPISWLHIDIRNQKSPNSGIIVLDL